MRRKGKCRINYKNHELKTTLLSLRNQDWKKVKLWIEEIKVLQHISTDVTQLNELINAKAKLICNKIGIPQRNKNKNSKSGLEMDLEGEIKKQQQQQQSKLLRKVKHSGTPRKEKNMKKTTTDLSDK